MTPWTIRWSWTISLCPNCREPLWFMACKCGWQRH